MKRQLVGVVWWPHSGGRWFCRTLIKPNSRIHETAFVHPWLFYTTDMTLELDITAQVHKARSLPELKPHLEALKTSTDKGREEGLKHYFNFISEKYLGRDDQETHILGEMCLGSPIPRFMDVKALYNAYPDFKLIHLIRNPLESFNSFTSRHELDSDPVKIAGSWLSQNAAIRKFFEKNTQFEKQYLPVIYENLQSDSEGELRRVCDFIGIDFENQMIESFNERWGRNTKPEISEDVRETIIEIASKDLKIYGYL
ncbi:MAG: sulfotransferase [Cyclobacteriaceae bacterium]